MKALNTAGADWRLIHDWAEAQIRTAHERLERPMPETETYQLRGRIEAMRDLLALGDRPETDKPQTTTARLYA